jgi:hypothetical protein
LRISTIFNAYRNYIGNRRYRSISCSGRQRRDAEEPTHGAIEVRLVDEARLGGGGAKLSPARTSSIAVSSLSHSRQWASGAPSSAWAKARRRAGR